MVIKMEINDGYMPFKGFKTYYRIVDGGDKTPLICLHGGPGSTHNYFEVLDTHTHTHSQGQLIIILKCWIVLPRREEK